MRESMGKKREAGYQDVLDAPEHVVAEVIGGVLHTQPRPRSTHAMASTALGALLHGPFGRGRGGPGGWVILAEPELHLGATPDILVPDLAGWRRERMPEMPDAAYFDLSPDWVCEVLSPKTARRDRLQKLPVYAREGVGHAWLVDADEKHVEVYRLDGETYRFLGGASGDEEATLEPFEAVPLELAALWER